MGCRLLDFDRFSGMLGRMNKTDSPVGTDPEGNKGH